MNKINTLVHALVNTAVDEGAVMAIPLAAEIVREYEAIESKLKRIEAWALDWKDDKWMESPLRELNHILSTGDK